MIDYKLINKSNVPDQAIDIIAKEVRFPKGKIIIILEERNVDNNQGECIPYKLLKYARRGTFFRNYNNWDVGIIIYPKGWSYYNNFPAYLTYLVGHELAHAQVCLGDLKLHLMNCLIEKHIREASGGTIKHYIQMPHEVLFDRYGLYVANMVYSQQETTKQFKEILNLGLTNDTERLKVILTESPIKKINITGLKESTLSKVCQYRSKLENLWMQEAEELRIDDNSTAALIEDVIRFLKNECASMIL